MTDYTKPFKPFPCAACGKMVMATERHTFEDCKDWIDYLRLKRKFEK